MTKKRVSTPVKKTSKNGITPAFRSPEANGRLRSKVLKRAGAAKKPARKEPKPRGALEIQVEKGQTNAEAVAEKLIGPANRHGNLAPLFGGFLASGLAEEDRPGILEYALEIHNRADKVRAGDLGEASNLLVAQALTLDGIFTELARRSAANMGEYLDASERFMRMALKAQAQSRATIEALAKLHQPREQTVRHVHVNEGGQAIVADEFHHHTGGPQNEEAVVQSHGPGAPPSGSTALLSQDATGNGLSVPCEERPEPLPPSRRERRRAKGQP